jgi:serine protease Do
MKKIILFVLFFAPLFTSSISFSLPTLKFGDPLPANAFVELAKAINPAVVNISTKIMPKFRGRNGGGGYRDPFLDMLEDMYGIPAQPMQVRPVTALGTGFLIREDGLILTNNHVIAGADEIEVQIAEGTGKFVKAKLIGSDDRTDIALIKIEGSKYPVLEMGSSADLQVGEWVAAFGNPLGNGHTMTKGIISAKGRSLSEINKFPLIQTDTPINPGNSGGPLVNMKGQVIGVNSAIAANAQGIGFAIPIDEVKKLLPQLEKNGRIKKGYLGVALADLDPQAAQALGLKDLEGAVIAQVVPRSPAAKAGFKPYDVITDFDGKKVKDTTELLDAVADAPFGKTVSAKIIREGRPLTLSVAIGEQIEPAKKLQTTKKFNGAKAPHNLGFQLAEPSPELIQEYNLDPENKKPVVVQVEPRSLSAMAGLQIGDLILDVNRKEVNSPADVFKQIKKGMNTLRLLRSDRVIFLMLDVPS